MRYLVTGGCGFIGAHLVDRLLADGHSVVIIDNLSTSKRENVPPQAEVIVADVTTPGVFDDIVGRVDGCFHLAAVVSVQQSTREWLSAHQVNLGGILALFDTLYRKGLTIPVVFASSAAVYGDNPQLPLDEGAYCDPVSAYGADKLGCELHAGVATFTHNIPTIGLRFFNVYGPRQDPSSSYSGVITIFTDQMKQNKPVTIFGDGNNARDFIYVGDVINGLMQSMDALEQKKVRHNVFNLCTGVSTTINALAEMIKSITNSRSQINHAKPLPDDIKLSVGSTEMSARLLGFKASVLLRDGLERTLGTL